jgi:hypothetical protein
LGHCPLTGLTGQRGFLYSLYFNFLKIKDLENVKMFTELDNRISSKEIINAIASLKNNKASSFDQVFLIFFIF